MIIYKINSTTNFEEYNNDFFDSLLNQLSDKHLLNANIRDIIITDDFEEEVIRQGKRTSTSSKTTINREYRAVSKIFEFKGSTTVIFDATIINSSNVYASQIFIEQLVFLFADSLIPNSFGTVENYNPTSSISDVVNIFFTKWAPKSLVNTLIVQYNLPHHSYINEVKSFTDGFKRNVRNLHFQYQKEVNNYLFWISIINEIDQFIRNCLCVNFKEANPSQLQEFESSIPKIINEIKIQTNNLTEEIEVDVTTLSTLFLDVLQTCFIDIPNEYPIGFKIIDSPIKLFKNNIIDTEPRIIAFIDILGFSAIIDEYDSDIHSNILNELHESLEEAIDTAIEGMRNNKYNTDLREHLEYRMFSDCICLSLPYIEFTNDFESQFNLIATIVKIYQLSMMGKGFFVRGGISTGSYFSNKNMIFSGGLVKAYKLEQSAVYPIIVIDSSIIEKLNLNKHKNPQAALTSNTFIYWKDKPNTYFLNFFDILDNSSHNIEFLQNTLNEISAPSGNSNNLDSIFKSILKTINDYIQPVFETTKQNLNIENIKFMKNNYLIEVLKQIDKLSTKLAKPELDSFERKEHEKILLKYTFLKDFIEWSMGKKDQNLFKEFKVK